MSARDIMPWDSPHGGHPRIQHFRLNASETFLVGEPVSVNADGELTESADDPVDADIMGIAAAPGGSGFNNPATGTTYATGDLVPVFLPDPTSYFITPNWSAAGSAFNDTAPALASIGDEAGLSLIGGAWGVDIGATNNTVRVVDILDANKRSLQDTGATVSTTGHTAKGPNYYIVFVIVGHQNTTPGAVDAPVA